MDVKLKSTLNNIFYAFTANSISMIISAIITLVVPKLLGVREYSYWQLYIFYTTYVGFFHLGWVDGIYLKHGGSEYDKLDYFKFTTQFWLLNVFEFIIGLLISIYAILFIVDIDKKLILLATCICGLITIAKTFFLYVFELSNRIKEYSLYTKVDRYIYFIAIMVLLLAGVRDYKILVIIDTFARFIALLLCMKAAPEVAFKKFIGLKSGLIEALDNISIGSKLMVANVASMLIVGTIRFAIEDKWSIEDFGKISLTISISNFIITAINATGVVMFPMLRRTSKEKLPIIYETLRTLLMIPLLAMLILYLPFNAILCIWLPQYTESICYMALLFPICVFECKMSLLINSYLKTFRKERWILLVNIITLIISIVITVATIFIIESITLAVLSISLILILRCVLAEILLSGYMNLDVRKDIVLEVILAIVFMSTSWEIGGIISTIIYILAYIAYLIIKKNDIKNAINIIKPLLNLYN